MGNCLSGGISNPEEEKKNKELNKILKDEGQKFKSEIRLLLLGAGESGKSTIAKQMKIIHMNGFSKEELESYKPLVHQNLYAGVKTLVSEAENLGVKIATKKGRAVAKKVLDDDYFASGEINAEMAKDIATLWADGGIQTVYNRRSEFQLSDCVSYYCNEVERLGAPGYIPTEQDVLRSRAKTTGIIETEFEVDGTKFRMVDVGGQRSERKKWMHVFQDVTAVIFCVALSEYDLKLEEDNETNRMSESINLFGQICNSKWFAATSMILFLNKRDIFEEKISTIPLTVAFPEYDGSDDAQAAAGWIAERFQEQNKNRNKQIYAHVTCATDTGNVRFVFNAVKDIILNQALAMSGLQV
eukprot:TRINITY_DN9746_c2_g1_i2.p1 TRINITY_DN9746_c2_g1~~TRINITY_DN9746_c2_g1_i2.p1  ORF type:complete len:356 (-),score=126.89 TRINITY_DN9746_c2_g1_i2:939-2006(-)